MGGGQSAPSRADSGSYASQSYDGSGYTVNFGTSHPSGGLPLFNWSTQGGSSGMSPWVLIAVAAAGVYLWKKR